MRSTGRSPAGSAPPIWAVRGPRPTAPPGSRSPRGPRSCRWPRPGTWTARTCRAVEGFPGGETQVAGLTYAPGTLLDVRVKAWGTGTTTLQATVWADGTPEPATPTKSTSDTTAGLQAAGGLGLAASLPGSATA